MEARTTQHDPFLEDAWLVRQRYWQRKLGRLRLGVEPLEEQLARYRRVTWILTTVTLALASMFVTLFAAFRRPDIGLILALLLFSPVVVLAWLDQTLLRLRAARYARAPGISETAAGFGRGMIGRVSRGGAKIRDTSWRLDKEWKLPKSFSQRRKGRKESDSSRFASLRDP